MDRLEADDLLIRVDRSATACLRLDWLGRSNARNPVQVIAPFFDQVLTEAAGYHRYVDMHFEALEHFNSSTIATLIHLINSAGRANVPLRVHYDGELRWQALAFDALKRAVKSFAQGQGPQVEFFSAQAQKQAQKQ